MKNGSLNGSNDGPTTTSLKKRTMMMQKQKFRQPGRSAAANTTYGNFASKGLTPRQLKPGYLLYSPRQQLCSTMSKNQSAESFKGSAVSMREGSVGSGGGDGDKN